jgi:hypothetical protein
MTLMARYRKPKEMDPTAPAPIEPRFLNVKQASAYLGIALSRMRKLVQSHTIKRIPETTKAILIAREELDRYAALMFKNSF